MSYQSPHRRKKNQKQANISQYNKTVSLTKSGGCISFKLADNEEILPDGRILIRGTLRPDGTRRPDRYKRAGFYNDEDLKRNVYKPKPIKQREEKQKQIETQNKQTIKKCVESTVKNVINNPPQSINTMNNNKTNLKIDFNTNVLLPLLNEFYENNKLELNKDITNYFIQNINKCQQLIDNNMLRIEIIKFIHKLLFDKRNVLTQNKNKKLIVKGKGNKTYGTGKMLSENIEWKSKQCSNGKNKKNGEKMCEIDDDKTDRKKRRNKIRKLNKKHKDIQKLEQRQSNGESLNQQQIDKIKTKDHVLEQLKLLKFLNE